MINTAKDMVKSRARRPVADDPDADHAIAAAAEEKVYTNQVMAHVRTPPDKEKEAVYLVFGGGLTHKEAARAMACKESTVSWYIHEARKKHAVQGR